MKVAPVSGDMLIKLALAGAGILAALYVAGRIGDEFDKLRDQLRGALDGAGEWAENLAKTTLNPANAENAVYKPITHAITTATGRDESLGTWLRGMFSNDDDRVRAMLEGKVIPASSVDPAGMY